MALRVLPFTATIPANTPKSALHTVALDLDGWEIESIDLQVPPGPSYLMGFYIANNGVALYPYGADQFLVWDDRAESWSLNGQPNAGGWAIVGYNLDAQYDHSVYVRFHVNPPAGAALVVPQITVISTPPPQFPVIV